MRRKKRTSIVLKSLSSSDEDPVLVARDEEKKVLLDALMRISPRLSPVKEPPLLEGQEGPLPRSNEASSELVVISGSSGVGKSALVNSLREGVTQANEIDGVITPPGIFAFGKFQQGKQTRTNPYGGLADAIDMLIRQLRRSSNYKRIKDRLRNEVNEHDMGTLVNVFPAFNRIINSALDNDDSDWETSLDFSIDAQVQELINPVPMERLAEHLRRFLNIVSDTLNGPIALFLDDIQWADHLTLDLVTYLVTDPKSKHILHMWTYRQDEIKENDRIKSVCKEVEDCCSQPATWISLAELDLVGVNRLLAKVLDTDLEAAKPLADLVTRRTAGNCFFVWHFLQMLQEDDLMVLSLEDFTWSWDLEAIEKGTKIASEGVADILVSRIHKLPKPCQSILSNAACFGTEFDEELVFRLVVELENQEELMMGDMSTNFVGDDNSGWDEEKFEKLKEARRPSFNEEMEELREAGLIEKANGDLMKFSHDRINKAVYETAAKEKRMDWTHLKIGRMLQRLRDSPNFNKDWVFFGAVDHLNKGAEWITAQAKASLVLMNAEASELARRKSAFIPATNYLKSGIALLQGIGGWKTQYPICLELYSSLAELDLISGNFKDCIKSVEEVVNNSQNVHDRFRVYAANIKCLKGQGKLDHAIDLIYNVLEMFGEPLPRNMHMGHVATGMIKAKLLLRNKSDDALASMAPMTDESKLRSVELLQLLSSMVFSINRKPLLLKSYMRMLLLSLKYGLNGSTCIAFVYYSMILCGQMDFENSRRFGELAFRMIDTADPRSIPELTTVYHVFVAHWQRPLRQSLEPLMEGYEVAMKTGEMYFGSIAACNYCAAYIHSGLPLKPVEQDLRNFLKFMKDYKQRSVYLMYLPLLQYILNLMGESDNPLVLTGEVMNQSTFLSRDSKKTQEVGVMRTFYHALLSLSVTFGDFEGAEELLGSIFETDIETIKTGLQHIDLHFLAALVYYERSRTVGRRKKEKRTQYANKAKKHLKEVEKWVKNGNMNCTGMMQLLHAEKLAAKKNSSREDVAAAFGTAIQSFTKSGIIHHAALANERAALYFLEEDGHHHGCVEYMKRAWEWYGEWGAERKQDQIELDHEFMTSRELCAKPSHSSYQGRSRFKKRSVENHNKLLFDDSATRSSSGSRDLLYNDSF